MGYKSDGAKRGLEKSKIAFGDLTMYLIKIELLEEKANRGNINAIERAEVG